MSWQALMLRLMLRQRCKQAIGTQPTIEDSRAFWAQLFTAPPPPPGVIIRHVLAGSVPAEEIEGRRSDRSKVLLYLHGGGFSVGSPESHRDLTWRLAEAAGMRAIVLDYRLAPEHPFPAALDDACTAYQWLLDQGIDHCSIAIAGDSAGGGLTLSTLVRLRDEGKPLPAAAALLSPWTDLAATGRSLQTNAKADPMLRPEILPSIADLYLGGRDPRDPLVSPLYADLHGLPPTIIHVGSTEILRDDAVRVAEKLRQAGVPVTLDVWDNMPHVWHIFGSRLPEAREAIDQLGAFLRAHVDAAMAVAA